MLVSSGVVDIGGQAPSSVTVLVVNPTGKDITVKPGQCVAELVEAEVAVSPTQSSQTQIVDPAKFNFGSSPVPAIWKTRLQEKVSARGNVFSMHEWDVGLAKGVEHSIRLQDTRPFRKRSRRIALSEMEDVRWHLQELLDHGIISETHSTYASLIVVAWKKSGNIRMCIDYRTLNSRTTVDQYTVPRVQDALDCLLGSQWFSVLDLQSGYYQIPLAQEDKEKTAFICPLGFYQFERMPQGISGAPATFQWLMEKVVGDMNMNQVLVYLDDLIVFGKTLEEHEERLLKVLDRLQAAGLKLALDKCQFCQTSVKYVGHIVSQGESAQTPIRSMPWQRGQGQGTFRNLSDSWGLLGTIDDLSRTMPDWQTP
ncbi:hypothetical protein Y1Q_0024279 [Alligator mississippiensis]|uniref:ribonuclease H n=1 Tax=Alligator mississippiensis TaxID=8496 RepID=A0A151NIJ5_ALLMI|nr:hypothetical protein Y1Q_0024279 [Alligator mississippiensis]